jgi:AcrR family transcriptional regulator
MHRVFADISIVPIINTYRWYVYEREYLAMSTQIERSNATRAKIVAVARAAFVRDGYEGASLDKIAAEANLTKGALYHHYNGKEAVFAAVFSLVSRETVEIAGKRARRTRIPREQLKAAAIAWLKAVERNDARIILLDVGPRALGFARVRALEDSITLRPLLGLVRAVIEAEQLDSGVDAMLAVRLINAALAEIALLRHDSDGRTPNGKMAAIAISGVIDGVLKGG